MPSNARQPITEEDGSAADAPDETFLVLCLELFTDWCRDIEHGKRAGDVKEQGSKSEVLTRADPTIEYIASGNGHHQVTRLSTYLLPDPNILSSGSLTELSSTPSLRNRSGSYVYGAG